MRKITQSDYKAAGRGLMRDCDEDVRRGLVLQFDVPLFVGDKVELHPACDLWMRGATTGTIHSIRNGIVRVRMDHYQVKRLQRFQLSDKLLGKR